ncbi:MAG: HlyD family efflux transporter periplasmic adaptor subunit [Beijerinckiaceae bacterium]
MDSDRQTSARDAATVTDAQVSAAPGAGAQSDLPLVVVSRSETIDHPAMGPMWRIFRIARFVPLLMLLMLAGGVVGLYFQPPGVRKAMAILGLQPGGGTSSPIAIPAPRKAAAAQAAEKSRPVAGLGRLLPAGEVITIAPPYGAGDARIATLAVKEGERVAKGQVLAVLDNERQLKAALETARAAVAARAATLAQVRAATLASREEAKAALERAVATAKNAKLDFDRSEPLRKRGYLSDQAYELRRTTLAQANRDVERARATLSRYGDGDVDKQPDVIVAARNLDSARADLDRSLADLDKAYARAPIDATVLTIVARAGEKPGAQGIMNIGDIDKMKIEVEVYQTEIKRVALGDKVVAKAESLPAELHGAVTRIGLEVAKQTLVDASPAANTDARVIKVSVTLDPDSSAVARRFTNLQVTAQIAVRGDP